MRRSSSGASERCQLDAAISRSAGRIVTCTSFSASANVAADTGGPVTGPVPNVGGAPGVAAGDAGGGAGPDDDGRLGAARDRGGEHTQGSGEQELSACVHDASPWIYHGGSS